MKRLGFLIILTICVLSIQILINCSNPLEFTEDPVLEPGKTIYDTLFINDTVFIIDSTLSNDTIFIIDTTIFFDTIINNDTVFIVDTNKYIDTMIIIDTILNTDTLIIIDTNSIVDTLLVFDTTLITDTVEIIVTDSTSKYICARLSSKLKDIVWMLQNTEGLYNLELTSQLDKLNPVKDLIVTIDGVEFIWNPFEENNFSNEQFLNSNSTITVRPGKPIANGHAIDICLKVTPL